MRIFHSTLKETPGSSTNKTLQTDAELKERKSRYRKSIDSLSVQSYRDLKPNKCLEDIDKTWRSAQELHKPSPTAQGTLQIHSDHHIVKSLHNLGGGGKLTDPDRGDELSLQKDLDFFQESSNANELYEKKSSSDEKIDSVRGLEDSKGRIESIFFASVKQKEDPGSVRSVMGPKRISSQMHLEGKIVKGASSDSLKSMESNQRRISLKKTSLDPILRGNLRQTRMNTHMVSNESLKAKKKGYMSRKTINSTKEPKESSVGTVIMQTTDKVALNPNFCYWDSDSMGNYMRYFPNGNCRAVVSRMRLKAEVFHGRLSSPFGGMSPALKRKKLRQSLKQLNWMQSK